MKRFLLSLTVLTLPAFAHATTDNSALTCGSTTATYYPRGDHWPAIPPIGNNPVIFLQQKDGAPGAAAADSLTAVNNAFKTWMLVKCPISNPTDYTNVRVIDGYDATPQVARYANRDRGDVKKCPSGADCKAANCDTETCDLIWAQNIVYFVVPGSLGEDKWSVIADPATVALTTNLYLPDTGYLVTSDMEFNAVNYQWRVGSTGCTSGQSSCFDVETVALHEAGHFLGFNHVMCSDAVMFPQGTGTQQNHALTTHEKTAICTIYPPRPASVSTDRYTGEQCAQTSQCPSGNVCIKPMGMTNADPWGWCAIPCSSTADCVTAGLTAGFICVQQDGGTQRFCRPGPNNTGGAVGADPSTGTALDLCQPCTAGSQCASGVCINQGGTTDGICTQTCVGGDLPNSTSNTGTGCPTDLTCTATDQGWSVCWPDDLAQCAAKYSRAKLNEICYKAADTSTGQAEYFKACGADLICFVFKDRCGGREGACVTYCNATDQPCAEESGYSCCFGVDSLGNCLGTASDRPHGGCFDVRRPGESCVTPEQSICSNGSSCFYFDNDKTQSKCYTMCTSSVGSCDADAEVCVTYSDDCNNSFSMCCDSSVYDDQTKTCVPTDAIQYWDVGVRCEDSSQCDSGLCQTFQGDKACSRPCNPVTGGGCPGNVDVNGDGTPDGGFRCLLISDQGRCWPTYGPVDPPATSDTSDEGGGCCNAMTLRVGDLFLTALVWVPLVAARLRRRRLG